MTMTVDKCPKEVNNLYKHNGHLSSLRNYHPPPSLSLSSPLPPLSSFSLTLYFFLWKCDCNETSLRLTSTLCSNISTSGNKANELNPTKVQEDKGSTFVHNLTDLYRNKLILSVLGANVFTSEHLQHRRDTLCLLPHPAEVEKSHHTTSNQASLY